LYIIIIVDAQAVARGTHTIVPVSYKDPAIRVDADASAVEFVV